MATRICRLVNQLSQITQNEDHRDTRFQVFLENSEKQFKQLDLDVKQSLDSLEKMMQQFSESEESVKSFEQLVDDFNGKYYHLISEFQSNREELMMRLRKKKMKQMRLD